jgi:plasmid maintenance system killer protein
MIASFACRDTKELFENKHVNRFSSFVKQAQIKLKLLNATKNISNYSPPPTLVLFFKKDAFFA